METENKKKHEGQEAPEQPSQSVKSEKGILPGQQIGLYSKADKKEVRQVVKILNPDKNSLESRG